MKRAALLVIVVAFALGMGCLAQVPPAEGPAGDNGAAPELPVWPQPEGAWIRPGVALKPVMTFTSLLPEGGGCTANFVFSRGPSLYLGGAAHCFPDYEIGDMVVIGTAPNRTYGALAYSSWIAMNLTPEAHQLKCDSRLDLVLSDDKECWNDFALIEINERDSRFVHPAVLTIGGPTALSTHPAKGDVVRVFGNSHYRESAGDRADARAGAVLDSEQWRVILHTGIPGVPGDSGGPVLDEAGRALGVLIYLHRLPPGANGAAFLPRVVEEAKNAGFDIELVTWQSTSS